MISGRVKTIAGSPTDGFKQGVKSEAQFNRLSSVCADPLNPNCYFVGDMTSVRYCDAGAKGGARIDLIAGGSGTGAADGKCVDARFNFVTGLGAICGPPPAASSDSTGADPSPVHNGTRLVVVDSMNNVIRMIDTETRTVSTIAGSGMLSNRDGRGLNCAFCRPTKLVLDRSPKAKPDFPVVWITSGMSCLRRFELETGLVTTIEISSAYPEAIDCTSTGHLIVSCRYSNGLFLIDPVTREARWLIGDQRGFSDGVGLSARFDTISDLVIVEEERSVYVTDMGNRRIRRVNIPLDRWK